MHKYYIDYVKSKKTSDRVYNALLDQQIATLQQIDSITWPKSKYCDLHSMFTEAYIRMHLVPQKTTHMVRQTDEATRRHLCIRLNGVLVAAESISSGVEILPIDIGMEKYAYLIKKYFAKRNDIHTQNYEQFIRSAYHSGVFIYVHEDTYTHDDNTCIYMYSSLNQEHVIDLSYNLILIGKGNHIHILDEQVPIQQNIQASSLGYTEIFVGEGSNVTFTSLRNDPGVKHIETIRSYFGKYAHFTCFDVCADASYMYKKHGMYLAHEDSEGFLYGAYVGDRAEIYEKEILIDNGARSSSGKVLMKDVVGGHAHIGMQGLIKVEPGADFVNSYLENHTLLVSDTARADSLPSLEIEADEVKASHGATIGEVDPDLLFYVQTRGLSEDEANGIIAQGFMATILDKLPAFLYEHINTVFQKKLHGLS